MTSKQYKADWYQKNKEKHKAQMKANRAKKKDEYRKTTQRYYIANRFEIINAVKLNKLRKEANPITHNRINDHAV